jgi:hypothetical protein
MDKGFSEEESEQEPETKDVSKDIVKPETSKSQLRRLKKWKYFRVINAKSPNENNFYADEKAIIRERTIDDNLNHYVIRFKLSKLIYNIGKILTTF